MDVLLQLGLQASAWCWFFQLALAVCLMGVSTYLHCHCHFETSGRSRVVQGRWVLLQMVLRLGCHCPWLEKLAKSWCHHLEALQLVPLLMSVCPIFLSSEWWSAARFFLSKNTDLPFFFSFFLLYFLNNNISDISAGFPSLSAPGIGQLCNWVSWGINENYLLLL